MSEGVLHHWYHCSFRCPEFLIVEVQRVLVFVLSLCLRHFLAAPSPAFSLQNTRVDKPHFPLKPIRRHARSLKRKRARSIPRRSE